ncbi:hypothetical protein AYL99_08440 [Fonsecaea erecta]|uniref:Protein kinase domain-containing protein n=1 Tax=Fonsecaea erecta TaxID=1367422 RepID=A0A178ZDG7_9EURO|nr:hypothetical protein AYL99_08440 [Fonsecaea erecta]OAP57702.1 hypothetical protein AYL99_08440 [Fonsecaea erecta]
MSWDLVDHFKLDAQIHADHTVHVERVSDPARGVRTVEVQKRWDRLRHIGHGAFGEVWLETCTEHDQHNQQQVRAVKRIQKRRMESVNIDYRRELLALAKVSRRQDLFVTLHGWYEDDDCVFLAMEYLPHGDLTDYIARGITEDGARTICEQLLEGLGFMHGIGFTHRDLKPQNIFVVAKAPQWWVKIGDFGISKRVASDQTALRTQVGTELFQAPEVLGYVEEAEETSEYTNAVDIWSLGCVVYYMLSQVIPFAGRYALNRYCSGRGPFPADALRKREVSDEGILFVQELLNPHPSQRLAAGPASQHAWFQASLPAEVTNGKARGDDHEVYTVTTALQETCLTTRQPSAPETQIRIVPHPAKQDEAERAPRREDVPQPSVEAVEEGWLRVEPGYEETATDVEVTAEAELENRVPGDTALVPEAVDRIASAASPGDHNLDEQRNQEEASPETFQAWEAKLDEAEEALARARAGTEEDETLIEIEQRLASARALLNESKKRAAAAAPAPPPEVLAPVRFHDAIGRIYAFPFERCRRWKDMEALIVSAFSMIEPIEEHIAAGKYDLVGDLGVIIMPDYWESTIKPGMHISMRM